MGKKNQVVWGCYTKLEKGVECNYCKKKYMVGNVNKMQSHLLACLRTPDDVKKIIREMSAKASFDQQSNQSLSASDDSIADLDSSMSSASSSAISTPKVVQKKMFGFIDKLTAEESVRHFLG